jgi:hypothetical protein
MALKRLALLGDVHPEAALSADGTRSLDNETEDIAALWRRCQVNEAPGHIGRSIILQRKQVDLTRGAHCDSTMIPLRVQENLEGFTLLSLLVELELRYSEVI